MNRKMKCKPIIGIVMAIIILISLFAVTVTPAAAWTRTAREVNDAGSNPGNDGNWGTSDDVGVLPVAIGELITLQSGTVAGVTTLTKLVGSPAVATGETIVATASGIDTVGASPGQYVSNNDPVTSVRLIEPVLDVSLRLSGTNIEVSSVVVGQAIDVVVDTNIPEVAWSVPPTVPVGPNALKLKIVNKKTGVQTTAGIVAGIGTNAMWSVITGAGGLATDDYTFTVETDGTGGAVAAIDIKSDAKAIKSANAKLMPTLPTPPRDLQATAGDKYVDVKWKAPSDDGGSPITKYKIYRGTSSRLETLLTTVGNVLIYTDYDVTNNQKYYYQVSAVNSAGEGEKSNEVDATTPTLTPAPTTPTPMSTLTSTPTPITPAPILAPTPPPGTDGLMLLIVALIGAGAVISAALIYYLVSRKTK